MAVKALRRCLVVPVSFREQRDGAHVSSVLQDLDPQTTMIVVVSKTFTTQETMANAPLPSHGLNRGEERLPNSLWRSPPIWKERAPSAFQRTKPLGLKIGSAGATPCGDRSACALPCPLVRNTSRHSWRVPVRSTNTCDTLPLKRICPCSLPFSDTGIRMPSASAPTPCCPTPKTLVGCRPICSKPTWRAMANSWGATGSLCLGTQVRWCGENRAQTASTLFSSCSTRDGDSPRRLRGLQIAHKRARGHAPDAFGQCAGAGGGPVARAQGSEGEPHRFFPGNRPSTFFLFDALSPKSLGMLVALHEHRIFAQGVLWGIASFDQWGVELGKAMANALLPELEGKHNDEVSHDPSTAALVKRLVGLHGRWFERRTARGVTRVARSW